MAEILATPNPRALSLPALLLGVSPALAAATRGISGLAIGGVVFVVLVLSTAVVALAGSLGRGRSGLLVHIGAVAVLATAADAALQAWAPALRAELGLSLQLAAAGCVIVGRAIPPRAAGRAVLQAAAVGLGLGACLFAMAVVREAFGRGTITLPRVGRFSGVLTLGALARNPSAVAIEAAGGLLVLGFFLGLARWVSLRRRVP